jgi:hypothetical protein
LPVTCAIFRAPKNLYHAVDEISGCTRSLCRGGVQILRAQQQIRNRRAPEKRAQNDKKWGARRAGGGEPVAHRMGKAQRAHWRLHILLVTAKFYHWIRR